MDLIKSYYFLLLLRLFIYFLNWRVYSKIWISSRSRILNIWIFWRSSLFFANFNWSLSEFQIVIWIISLKLLDIIKLEILIWRWSLIKWYLFFLIWWWFSIIKIIHLILPFQLFIDYLICFLQFILEIS